MNKKNDTNNIPGDQPDLIDQSLRHHVERIKPSGSFIERLSVRLRREHQAHEPASVKRRWRMPVWGYGAAVAALLIVVFVVRGLWPGEIIPAEPTDIVVASITPGIKPTVLPTDEPLPTPTEEPTPEPEPGFAADLPPAILKIIPRPGEEVNTKAGILLRFTQPMNRESVEGALEVKPEVEGTFAWEDGNTVTFTPKVLASGVRYHVSVGADAFAENGKPLTAELAFDFSTIGPLEVTHAAPVASTADVRSDTPLIISFNYPMVPINCSGQVAGQSEPCAALPLQIVPNITGQGMWVNTSLYRFDPLPGWDAGTTYAVSIPSGVQSVGSAELPEPYDWTFVTALPRVVDITPNRARNMPLDVGVTVRFNTPMATRLTAEAFALTDDQGNRVNGEFTWNRDNTVVVYTPTQLLALDTTYTVRITEAAESVNGAALSKEKLADFITAPPPSVLRIRGSDDTNTRLIDYYEPVLVEFQGLIDAETIQDQFTVTDNGEVVEAFNVWWNVYEDNRAAYITWDKTPGGRYCVTVLPGISDIYGNTIDEQVEACFQGGDLPAFFSPATQLDTLTLDAAEPAQLYFVTVNVDKVMFTLSKSTEYGFVSYEKEPVEAIRRWTLTLDGDRNDIQTIPLDLLEGGTPLPSGYYELTWDANVDRWGQDRLRLAVLDRHVTLKMSEDEALVWVTDLRSAVPIASAPVRVLAYNGRVLGAASTDADGIARIPISIQTERWDTFLAVTGEPGSSGFGVARSDWNRGVDPWSFDIPADYGQPPDYKLYLHTDRPIYRPGQTIYFRGIVRADDDVLYSLPSQGTQVKLELHDAYYDVVADLTLETSESGIFDGAFVVPVDGKLGAYSLNAALVDASESSTTAGVTVAAYRKPDFEVVVTPEQHEMLNGDEARVLVETNYYAGGPVSHARVHWTVSAEPYTFDPGVPGWWNWGFDPFGWEWWREPEVLAEGDAVTDANGKFMWQQPVELKPLGDSEGKGPQTWRLEVTVTDEAGLPVTGSEAWVVHQGAFYLGLKPRSWVAYAGTASNVDVLALGWEGTPVAAQAVRVQLAKRTWEMVSSTEPYAAPNWIFTDEVEDTQRVVTDQAGNAVASFKPAKSGSYVVIAESTDQHGNVIRSETYLWIAGPEAAAWQQPENQVKPIADARSYRPGDVARILLPTSFAPPYEVLMTVERAGILHVERFTMQESNPVIEVPIDDTYVPNVIVSFIAVKGITTGQFTPDVRIGMVELPVEPGDKLLTVEITPVCDSSGSEMCVYEPGETARLNIRTLDNRGVPVSADVSVAVVDKSVLALVDPEGLTLQEAFYAPRPLRVFTGDGLIALFNRSLADLEQLAQAASKIAKQMLVGGIGGGGGGATYQADVRSDFPDTALWEAQLKTGADGTTEVQVDLPDSLTTWVVDVRAVTAASLVGQGTAEFMVTKPLLVRPVTPRFLTAGDAVEVAAVVHNNTDTTVDAVVSLDAAGVTFVDAQTSTQSVSVVAQGRARVAWQLQVPLYGPPDAQLTFTAEGGGYRDAARPNVGAEDGHTLPVYRYEAPDVFSTSGELTSAGTRLEAIVVPPEAGPASMLTLRLEPTLAAGMLESLTYLENFTHACNEQLVSRFLPNVVTYLALKDLGYDNQDLETKLWPLIKEALNQLYSRQQSEGGWGWWSEKSEFQLSAYALLGMVKAQQAGFTVNRDALSSAADYLARTLEMGLNSTQRSFIQAFALYVLTEGGYTWPEGADATLYASREQLGATGKAFLGLALGLEDSNDPRVQTLLEDLRTDAEITASGVHWEDGVGNDWQTWTRTTSVVLDTFARLAPDDPLIPQTVRWLMVARKADKWETTQETAWAVIGLTDALVATSELQADYSWGVALNMEVLEEGQVSAANLRQPIALTTSVSDLLREWPNALEISRGDGAGVLYYTADFAVYLPVEDLQAESRGISVERQYCVYTPVSSEPLKPGDELTPCVPVTSARPGDLIEVRLTLTLPRMRNYLILEDAYPAGMEPVDPSLATESDLVIAPEAQSLTKTSYWWQPTFEHSELRDERAVFYASSLASGTYQARYLLRATFPGVYNVLPATAGEMYFPSVNGRSDGSVFTIAP